MDSPAVKKSKLMQENKKEFSPFQFSTHPKLKYKTGMFREELIELAEQEIRQWQKFLKDLKKEK